MMPGTAASSTETQPCPPVDQYSPPQQEVPAIQPGQGPALTTSMPTVVGFATTEESIGGPLEHIGLGTRGQCVAGPHWTYIRPLLQDWEM